MEASIMKRDTKAKSTHPLESRQGLPGFALVVELGGTPDWRPQNGQAVGSLVGLDSLWSERNACVTR